MSTDRTKVSYDENIMTIEFSVDDFLPLMRQKQGQDYVMFGEKNDWPEQTMDLYKRCVDHGAIIRGKARYISGKGLKVVKGSFPLFDRANLTEKFNKVFKKAVKDWEIHRGYALKVKYNAAGKVVRVYHIPFQKVRTNEERTKFWTSDKWTNYRMRSADITGEFWGMGVRKNTDLQDEIFYYVEEDEEGGVYPLPAYMPATKSLKTGLVVEDFHWNNANSGFTAGTMVTTFPGSKVDEDERKKVKAKFDSKTTGSANAGRVILYFAGRDEQEPKIQSLTGDNLDQKYQPLSEQVQQKTFTAHNVTSPILFGIKTEGQLGGRTEIVEAWELFYNNYVEPEQENIIESLEIFAGLCGFGEVEFEIEGVTPLGLDYISLLDKGIVSAAYVQEKLNLPVLKSTDEDRAKEEEDALKTFEENGTDAADLELMEDINLELKETLDKFETKLLKAVKEQPKYSIKDYSLGLRVSEAKVKEGLDSLLKSGFIVKATGTGDGMSVTPTGQLIIGDGGGVLITTMYKYDGPQDDRNRAFCARLMALNRVYSKEDIQKISDQLGYDVWKYRGGWYKRTDGVNIPHCRHTWKPVIVRKKK